MVPGLKVDREGADDISEASTPSLQLRRNL